jgi:hypothetical protein
MHMRGTRNKYTILFISAGDDTELISLSLSALRLAL